MNSDKKAREEFIAKLNRRGFKQDLDVMALCRESYAGGTDYINPKNLFSHCRERSGEYADRLKRAYYLNYSAPIVDTYCFFIFKSAVTRQFKEENMRISMFISNCDRKGTSLDEFMKSIVTEILTVGRSFIVIDVPQIETLTLLEELEANKRPYLYTIKSEDVLDLEEDDSGLIWIKYKEERSSKGGSFDYDGDGVDTRIVIWEKGRYRSYSQKGELLEDIRLSIDFVPIVKVEFNKGKSLISDIARVNRSLFNWSSLLDEILYRQTFSWLIIPADKTESLSEKKVGTSWAFTFDPESHHVPQFISPDTSQAGTIETRCEKAIAEIYRIANLDWANSQQAAKSGIAKGYDFMNVNKALASIAYSLQETEKRIFKFIALYYGRDIDITDGRLTSPLDVIIQYPNEFSYTAVSEKLNNLYTGITVEWSNRFRKLCAKDIVTSNFPMLSEAEKKEIYDEIEEYFDKQEELASQQEDFSEEDMLEDDGSIASAEDAQGDEEEDFENYEDNENI